MQFIFQKSLSEAIFERNLVHTKIKENQNSFNTQRSFWIQNVGFLVESTQFRVSFVVFGGWI